MAQVIVQYLNAWHHNQQYTLPLANIPPILQDAITDQSSIGWTSFIEGFWSKHWRRYQQQHLAQIRSKRSALLWISKLQRKIWHIAWELWTHRNNRLHSQGATIHQYDTMLINQEIEKEWMHQGNLPQKYNNLFRGTLQEKLQSDIHQKRRWLANIWIAQEAHLLARDNRNEHISKQFERWKSHNAKYSNISD